YWSDAFARDLEGPQTVNDSKTPSGRVHVGALRGVLIHDAVYRSGSRAELDIRYKFGVDDYDPLDELPAGLEDQFRPYLGQPLCNVPSPPGSAAADFAEHYISEFFDVFVELGVGAETYRMRDVYRSGQFNDSIDILIRNADAVRRIDQEVSGAKRPPDWIPFQPVCEQCGRIGTTRAFDYDGSTVGYRCEPDLVKWASGCGNAGRVSPFNGNGKLPWKFEWVAKWHEFPVTIEGAGKDHNSKGGSREVAVRCLTEVFGDRAPRNIPYEFFLVGGAKMSSSRGIGVTARDMADFLPPEVLRFLFLRSQPRSAVDFSPDEKKIVQLFSDFDRHRDRTRVGTATEVERRIFEISSVTPLAEEPQWAPPLDTVLSVVQMPHLDVHRALAGLKGSELTEPERREVERRVRVARYWLDHFATPEERQELQSSLPESAASLSGAQRGFLGILHRSLESIEPWSPDGLQGAIFECARLTPLDQRSAFAALYCVFLDRSSGPKAGNLLAFLGRTFVVQRLGEVNVDREAFVHDTASSLSEVEELVESLGAQVSAVELSIGGAEGGARVLDLVVRLHDGRGHGRRIVADDSEQPSLVLHLENLAGRIGATIVRTSGDLGPE
ncbi:MAG: lysine--tRNA ligase, partial [Acidimicrobiales bacterium]